jgi:hypothetical protein
MGPYNTVSWNHYIYNHAYGDGSPSTIGINTWHRNVCVGCCCLFCSSSDVPPCNFPTDQPEQRDWGQPLTITKFMKKNFTLIIWLGLTPFTGHFWSYALTDVPKIVENYQDYCLLLILIGIFVKSRKNHHRFFFKEGRNESGGKKGDRK